MATMDLINWTLLEAQLLSSEPREPNNVDAIPSIEEFIALVKGDSFGSSSPKIPSTSTISSPDNVDITDIRPAIEAPLRDGAVVSPEPNALELPVSTPLESSDSAEELPAPAIDSTTSIQVIGVQLAVKAPVRQEAAVGAKPDAFGLPVAAKSEMSTVPQTKIEAVVLQELHASETSTMVDSSNEAGSVPEPNASELPAIAQTGRTYSETTNETSQAALPIPCVQLAVELLVHDEAAGAPKSNEFESPLPVQTVSSQSVSVSLPRLIACDTPRIATSTFAETPIETPRSTLLMAITKAGVHNTTPIDRDRAIALRWTLRDIKGRRWKLSSMNQDDLQTLRQLELVEMQNNVPVLTSAGLNAIA